MTRHSRTQSEIAENHNKEQILEIDSQLNKLLVLSDTHFKITIFREIDQKVNIRKKCPLYNLFVKYNFRTKKYIVTKIDNLGLTRG